MTNDVTDAGTPVLYLDAREYEDFLEQEVQSRLGMTAADFRRRYAAADLDEAHPDVSMLAGLMWMAQNGVRTAA